MKVYVEATEIVPMGQPAEFLRAEVTGKTDAEIIAIIQDVKDVMAGKVYDLIKHYCYHEENGLCIPEVIP